jgi:hypothetical protein
MQWACHLPSARATTRRARAASHGAWNGKQHPSTRLPQRARLPRADPFRLRHSLRRESCAPAGRGRHTLASDARPGSRTRRISARRSRNWQRVVQRPRVRPDGGWRWPSLPSLSPYPRGSGCPGKPDFDAFSSAFPEAGPRPVVRGLAAGRRAPGDFLVAG